MSAVRAERSVMLCYTTCRWDSVPFRGREAPYALAVKVPRRHRHVNRTLIRNHALSEVMRVRQPVFFNRNCDCRHGDCVRIHARAARTA